MIIIESKRKKAKQHTYNQRSTWDEYSMEQFYKGQIVKVEKTGFDDKHKKQVPNNYGHSKNERHQFHHCFSHQRVILLLFAKLLFLVYLPKKNHFHNLVIDFFQAFFVFLHQKGRKGNRDFEENL